MKLCSKCGNSGKFYKDSSKRDGLHPICVDCHYSNYRARMDSDPLARTKCRERSRDWRKLNPEKSQNSVRNATLKSKYGITSPEYDAMLCAQNGVCKVCETSPDKQRLHVDHCHASGKIRGLLCQACNVSIGKMRESPELLRRLATYIEENKH